MLMLFQPLEISQDRRIENDKIAGAFALLPGELIEILDAGDTCIVEHIGSVRFIGLSLLVCCWVGLVSEEIGQNAIGLATCPLAGDFGNRLEWDSAAL